MIDQPVLAGKVAIVTGGGQGVGLGIAKAFVTAGASVVVSGRTRSALESATTELIELAVKDKNVGICVADAGTRDGAKATIYAALAKFGQIDILVNNAQSSVPGILLEDLDDATLALTLQSGLLGTIYHMQEALPHMKARGGSIINLGSREGIEGGVGFGAYAATKEAIRGVSRVAAREWGKYLLRVNVINPAALSPAAITYLDANPQEAERYLKEIALGRFGDPQADIGPVAVFLASDAARYVTGQTINADGGQMMG